MMNTLRFFRGLFWRKKWPLLPLCSAKFFPIGDFWDFLCGFFLQLPSTVCMGNLVHLFYYSYSCNFMGILTVHAFLPHVSNEPTNLHRFYASHTMVYMNPKFFTITQCESNIDDIFQIIQNLFFF